MLLTKLWIFGHNSVPLWAKLFLHLPDDQFDLNLFAGAALPTAATTDCLSESRLWVIKPVVKIQQPTLRGSWSSFQCYHRLPCPPRSQPRRAPWSRSWSSGRASLGRPADISPSVQLWTLRGRVERWGERGRSSWLGNVLLKLYSIP